MIKRSLNLSQTSKQLNGIECFRYKSKLLGIERTLLPLNPSPEPPVKVYLTRMQEAHICPGIELARWLGEGGNARLKSLKSFSFSG